MYAIIYWVYGENVKPVLHPDKTLMVFDSLEEADSYANKMEHSNESRVISIDSVHD